MNLLEKLVLVSVVEPLQESLFVPFEVREEYPSAAGGEFEDIVYLWDRKNVTAAQMF